MYCSVEFLARVLEDLLGAIDLDGVRREYMITV